jgi:hypothetical protein
MERRLLVEKKIVTGSYWLGWLCFLIALGMRSLSFLGILIPHLVNQGTTLGYNSFYKGALLFFLIAIATASYASVRGERT